MQTAGVLCCWLVLVGAAPVVGMEGPDGRVVGAKMWGRFTVLPQMLRIAEEDPGGWLLPGDSEPRAGGRCDGSGGGNRGYGPGGQPSCLTFTPENWADERTVTVVARGDVDAVNEEVKLVHRANGNYLFGATVEVLVTVLDDEEPSTAVEIRTDTALVEEGGGARTVAVTAAYDGAAMIRDVGLRIDVGGGTADRLFDFQPVESFVLRIPAGAGSASGTFTLTPVDDDLDEDDEMLTIGGVIFSPPGGLGLSVEAASVAIADDDTRGVVIGASALTLEQGNGTTYAIGLASRPTEDVTVEVVAPADGALLVPDRSIVFGTSHWATPQEVRLHAKNDGTPVPDGPVILTHRVSGGDYQGMTAGSVAVTIVERMLPTIMVADTRASEGADALEFEISLDSAATRQVTVYYDTYSPLSGVRIDDAVHLSDYRGRNGRITFSPGETLKRVRVC